MDNLLGTHPVIRDGAEIGTLTITQSGNMTAFDLLCRYNSVDVLRLAGVSSGNYVNIGVAIPEGGNLILKKKFSKSSLAVLKLETEAGFHLIRSDESYAASQDDSIELRTKESEEPKIKSAEPIIESLETQIESTTEAFEAPAQETVEEALTEILDEPQEKSQSAVPAENPPENTDILHENTPEAESVEPESAAPELNEQHVEPELSESTEATQDDAPMWTPIADPSALFGDPDIVNACKGITGALTMKQEGITLLAIPLESDKPFPLMPVFCFGDSAKIDGVEYIVFKSKDGNFVM